MSNLMSNLMSNVEKWDQNVNYCKHQQLWSDSCNEEHSFSSTDDTSLRFRHRIFLQLGEFMSLLMSINAKLSDNLSNHFQYILPMPCECQIAILLFLPLTFIDPMPSAVAGYFHLTSSDIVWHFADIGHLTRDRNHPSMTSNSRGLHDDSLLQAGT